MSCIQVLAYIIASSPGPFPAFQDRMLKNRTIFRDHMQYQVSRIRLSETTKSSITIIKVAHFIISSAFYFMGYLAQDLVLYLHALRDPEEEYDLGGGVFNGKVGSDGRWK